MEIAEVRIKNLYIKRIIDSSLSLLIFSAISYFLALGIHKIQKGGNLYDLHSLMELVTIIAYSGIFLMSWKITKPNHNIHHYVGIGFLLVSLFYGFHIITFYVSTTNPGRTINLSIFYANLGRIVEGIVFILIAINLGGTIRNRNFALLIGAGTAISLFYFASTFHLSINFIDWNSDRVNLPRVAVYSSEFMLYSTSLVFLLARNHTSMDHDYDHLIKGISLSIFSIVCAFCYHNVNSVSFLLSHTLKLFSVYFIFSGLTRGINIYPNHEIEKLYQENEERFKNAFDKLSAGVVMTDINGEVIKTNEHADQIMNIFSGKPSEFNIAVLLPKGQVELSFDCLISILHNYEDKILCYSVPYPSVNGRIRMLNVSVSSINDRSSMPIYILFELQEDSQRQKIIDLETDILRNRKILQDTLQAEHLKMEFFSNLSHELRTPINVISGSIQLLELYMKDNINDNIKRNINYMKINSRRMLRLVNNLLDSSKIESGFYQLEMRSVDIVCLVEDIAQSVVEYMNLKQLEFVFDTDIEEKMIHCDPDKIERIVLNLLSNAIKFTNPHGRICITVQDEQNGVTIVVQDNGIGIPKDMQQMVFERYKQVRGSLIKRSEGTGTGIGLALIKSLVELHHGEIKLVSDIGCGCEFVIFLPDNLDLEVTTAEFPRDHSERIERVKVEFSDVYGNE